jgi:hypothetical protein
VASLRVGLMGIGVFYLMNCTGWIGVLFDWLKCFHHFASRCTIQQFLILLV